MAAVRIDGPLPEPTKLKIKPVNDDASLAEFCRLGAECFRVPPDWFEEIYDGARRLAGPLRGWVGYLNGEAVATVATVASDDVVGVYNLATGVPFRKRGFGEAMSRHAVTETFGVTGEKPIVLQSTTLGLRLYRRLGFQAVGRILVFPSR